MDTKDNQLTLTDIYKMRSVIDVASTRGTFQGKELSIIGELYNKLEGIVASVEKNKPTENAENAKTTETEDKPVVEETVADAPLVEAN